MRVDEHQARATRARARSRSAIRAALGLAIRTGLLLLAAGCSEEAEEPRTLHVGPDDPTPVVLVVVDTLRADHLGAYGSMRATSPGIDQWSRRGRLFEQAHATSCWTLPSFGSLYTGHLPSLHGAGAIIQVEGEPLFTGLTPGLPTLAELLHDHGWATAALVNNPFLAPEFGLGRGFETYDYVAGGNQSTRRADEMVDRSLAWIDAQKDSRFFLVVHLFDPHMDYDPPSRVRGRFTTGHDSRMRLPIKNAGQIRTGVGVLSDADKSFISAAYDEEIAFVDSELTRFSSALEERGILDHGLVILTSDHGEELFEHGSFEHGHAMWEELLHIPMVIWGTGIEAGREETPVSLVDIAPTILEFLDLPIPGGLEGRSLVPTLHGASPPLGVRPLYSEFALYGADRKVVIDWPQKLVLDPASGLGFSVRLDTDPLEQHPIGPLVDQAAKELAQATLEKLAALAAQVDQQPAELSAITLEKLRQLGYRE